MQISHFLAKRSRLVLILGTMSSIALSSCNDGIVTCAGVGTRGFTINVRDASSQADLNKSALVKVVSLTSRPDSLSGAPEDAVSISDHVGSYRIEVTAAGYVAQSRQVEVSKSTKQCVSVDTQELTFNLVKSS